MRQAGRTFGIACVIGILLATSTGMARDDASTLSTDISKAQVEKAKIEIERQRLADNRVQFYFDWLYKVALAGAALLLAWWAIPQFSEITVPFGGGTLTAKRAPKQASTAPAPEEVVPLHVTEVLKKELALEPTAEKIVERLEETDVLHSVGIAPDAIYVCHRARRIRGSDQYQVHIYLDADDNATLAKVDRVVYRLHETFSPREVTVSSGTNQFALDITAWGEFMLYAFVHFKGHTKPVELKRYLNF